MKYSAKLALSTAGSSCKSFFEVYPSLFVGNRQVSDRIYSTDYVGVILGLSRDDSDWRLDPLAVRLLHSLYRLLHHADLHLANSCC